VAHRVEVPAQRSVHEPELHARRDFVNFGVVFEVGSDSPIMLAERRVVDPSAARSLQQRVREQEHELAPRLEHASDLVDREFECVDVFEREADDNSIEAAAAARQRLRARTSKMGSASTRMRRSDLGECRIEPNNLDARTGDAASDLSFAAPNVENSSCADEMPSNEWEELLVVLGI
jgi:hypothetical protein